MNHLHSQVSDDRSIDERYCKINRLFFVIVYLAAVIYIGYFSVLAYSSLFTVSELLNSRLHFESDDICDSYCQNNTLIW